MLRSIQGLLKVETARKIQLEECIEREMHKLSEIENNPEYDDSIQVNIGKRIKGLNDILKVRQESIDFLKGRFTNQITGIKEMIAKVLERYLKRYKCCLEQDIMIASISITTGMAISILVEALLPSGRGGAAQGSSGTSDKLGNGKEWLRNKLKALAMLLGRLGTKAAEALPVIVGVIISWILNRVKDVVGWVWQSLWALVISIGGLLYMYMVTRK